MRLGCSLLVALVASPLLAQQPGGLGPVVDEVAAVVGDRVVTRSDLELEARVVLIAGGGVDAAFAALDADTVESVLNYLGNQLLIVAEAERLEVFEVAATEVDQEVDSFAARFEERSDFEAFLQSQDTGLDRLRGIFRRNLRVKSYLDSRVKLTVRVRDVDVEAFYEGNRDRFVGRELSEVREVIRGFLFKQRYEESVRALVESLRERGTIRRVAPPGSIPAVPRPPVAEAEAPAPRPGSPPAP